MKDSWTKGLDEERATEIRKDFRGCSILRKRQVKIIEDKIKSTRRSSRNKDGYDCPNWTYKQADAIGYERALHEIIELIST